MTRDEALADITANPHEAVASLRQAQALVRQHGLTAADVVFADVKADQRRSAGGLMPPRYLAELMNTVGATLGACPIWWPVRRGGRWQGGVQFIGVGGRAEIAGYAYEVLGRQLARARAAALRQHRRLRRDSRIRRADAYCAGWVDGVRQHVTALAVPREERVLIRQYCERLDLTVGRATERVHGSDAAALQAGYRDGLQARLRHGVDADGAPRRIGYGAE